MKYLRYFFKDLKQVGAVAPSSKFLAKDLVAQLRERVLHKECAPLNILEVGPGTGSLTKQITKWLRPKDHLDTVEIHKKFYQIIKSTYRQSNIEVYHNDILKFHPDYHYDFIFSSLPYENMSDEISKAIWERKLQLCKSSAFISYFKYVKFGEFKCDFEEKVVNQFGCDKSFVLLNLPPAKVYTLEINKRDQQQAPGIQNMHVA